MGNVVSKTMDLITIDINYKSMVQKFKEDIDSYVEWKEKYYKFRLLKYIVCVICFCVMAVCAWTVVKSLLDVESASLLSAEEETELLLYSLFKLLLIALVGFFIVGVWIA